MVKSQLVQKLCNMHPKVIRKDLEQIVSIIIHEMIESLSRDEAVEIRGWGRIKTGIRKARIGRNPKTRETVNVPEKYVPHFKAGKELRIRVDK